MELGADDNHGIEAVAAVDADRSVDDILNFVGAFAAIDEGHRLLGGFIQHHEGAHGEAVVIRAALEAQHSQVVIHLEGIFTCSTVSRDRVAGAIAQEAARGFHGGKFIARQNCRRRIARRFE